MPERALVLHPATRTTNHRDMAEGIQRGATEEGSGRADTVPTCKTTGKEIDYSNRRTLDLGATQKGVTPDSLSNLNWVISCHLIPIDSVTLRGGSDLAHSETILG